MASEHQHRNRPPGADAPFPSHSAFVVQLDRSIDSALTRFVGRVEHLESGQRAHFETVEELLAAMKKFLVAAGNPNV